MDGHTRLGSSDLGQDSLDAAGQSPVAAPAGAAGMRTGGVASRVAWLSSRADYWPLLEGGEARNAPSGVACLLFGVGTDSADWLARLARSTWFAGLEPRATDLAPAGGISLGSWAMPVGGDAGRVAAEAEVFFASASLPSAWYAAVAVPRGAGPAERSAALGLIGALRARRDPLGCGLSVIVTVEAAVADGFVRRLLDRGTFVVRGGASAGSAGDHLHHFPLRAVVNPRRGRLICVDLADYLYTWRPGRVADLHVVPFAGSDAERALRGLSWPLVAGGDGACALNLGFHLDPCAPGMTLAGIDRFAARCSELLLAPGGDAVFTDTERLDGAGGSVDLLVVRDGVAAGR